MTNRAVTLSREDPRSSHSRALIAELDEFSASLYPPESNHLDSPDALSGAIFIVLREDSAPAGCGAVKLSEGAGELKRMFVRPAYRGRGYGRSILEALEREAKAAGVAVLRLETGIHNADALKLYRAAGFVAIASFPPYAPDPLSLFFEKRLIDHP